MIIFRYLVKEVYGTMLATTGVLLLILISNQFVHYLGQAAAGMVPVHTVMQMMSLQVPLLLGLLLPLGLFLGILMAYGRLYTDNEMTVLSACGFSKARLLGYTLIFAALVAVVVAILMLWLQPKMEWYKRYVLQEAAQSSPLERIFPNQFVSLDGGKIVFYANSLSTNRKQLQQVFIAQPPSGASKLWNVVAADAGQQWIDPQTHDRFVVFNNGNRYTGVPGSRDFQIVNFASYGVRIQQAVLPPSKNPAAMNTVALWQQSHGHPDLEAELQWRISLPLSVFILTLLAVPLSYVRPRQGRFAQLIPALLLYIVYADFLFMGQAWLQKGVVNPVIGMWWVHGLMLIIAAAILLRYFGWGQVRRQLGMCPK